MKSIIFSFVLLFCSLSAFSQPGSVQKVSKSVFTLTTFKKDGSVLASGYGIFIGTKGEAVSCWTPFVGADSAIVTDAGGKNYPVETMYGASEVYDVCKFKVNAVTVPAVLAKSAMPVGTKLWQVGYSVSKPVTLPLSVQKAERFNSDYNYYLYTGSLEGLRSGCPAVNQRGEVVGMLQQSKVNEAVYSIDLRYTDTFKTTGLSVNDPILQQTGIRIALPDEVEQASLMLMLAVGRFDTYKYQRYIDNFIELFPRRADGYVAQAELYVNQHQFEKAATVMTTALAAVDKKDEVHYDYAKLIYQKEVKMRDIPYAPWTLDLALNEAEKAYKLNALPVYQHLQAQIIYYKGDYQRALDMFLALTRTNLRNGELFYEAAQCKQQLKVSSAEILALLDSAVVAQPLHLSTPYLLARANALSDQGQYRKAIVDYNRYDSLLSGRASHDFYYAKFLCEVQLRQFQQALGDIAHAIVLNRTEPVYYAEMARLQLRVNQLDDAIQTADLGLHVAPDYPDLYLMKGLALINKKQKKEGLEMLVKAQTLGDARAEELIKKYK
jgi:tetratricopeptide repeat family protein